MAKLLNTNFFALAERSMILLLQASKIGRALGDGFDQKSQVMLLCPHCCSSEMFIRSGAAHAFHREEVEACNFGREVVAREKPPQTLHCSRYHVMPASDVIGGCLVKFNQDSMPLMFPGVVEKLQGLDWSVVGVGGVLRASMDDSAASLPGDDVTFRGEHKIATSAKGQAAGESVRLSEEPSGQRLSHSTPQSSQDYRAGTFLAMSFFVMTGQVVAGQCLRSDQLHRFKALCEQCSDESVETCTHKLHLIDDSEVQLQFRFKVGDIPANPGGRKIESIYAADVGDALGASPSFGSFSCFDNVLVVFQRSADDKSPQFLQFAGNRNNLRLCRLTAATRGSSRDAAECWSELQDYFAIVMGPEFENYELTALTLFRNDERARAFVQQMTGMQERRRESVRPWEDRGQVAAVAVAALGGGACRRYRGVFGPGGFDWVRARTMNDDELKKELERLDVSKEHMVQVLACVKQLQYTFDAQEATMRHFKDHAGKFGLLPADKNADVNLTLAWWGNSRGNAV